jgi:hypothetical protein
MGAEGLNRSSLRANGGFGFRIGFCSFTLTSPFYEICKAGDFLAWRVRNTRYLLKEGRTIRVEIIKRKKYIWNSELLIMVWKLESVWKLVNCGALYI